MSKPTPEIPSDHPNDTPSNKQDDRVNEPADTPLNSEPVVVDEARASQEQTDATADKVEAEKAPATDISLISADKTSRNYEKDNQSFLCSAAIRYC